jgi:hypothetical protein
MQARFLAAAALVAAGCAHGRMLPGPAADVVPGAPDAALDHTNGVEVSADGDDWEGRPADLPERLTPVKVRIVNHSGRPLEILYERFMLAGTHGHRYQPLPPVPIDHRKPLDGAGTVSPIFAAESFFVARRYGDVYPSLPAWSQPLPRAPGFAERQFARWPQNLPTREMQRLSLPEGVLADGGEVAGYLFFEDATRHESRLAFKASLDDGDGQGSVAEIDIPFRVE